MLNHSSDENKVRFLQEGAVMGQFKHRNIVALHGLILEGEPVNYHVLLTNYSAIMTELFMFS